eukprot:2747214-Pyramimonas_sp.AAC.1
MREAHAKDPSQPLPEVGMGPACVQIFLLVCKELVAAGVSVGAMNQKAWTEQQGKLDQITDIAEMNLLVRAFRVSLAFKEGVAKITFAFSDTPLTR